jgi:hypothetical protein
MLEKFLMPIFEVDGPNDYLFQHGGKFLYFHILVQPGILVSKNFIGMGVHTRTTNQKHNYKQTKRVEYTTTHDKSCTVYYAHTQQEDIYTRVKIETFSNNIGSFK